jgi:hypothetical protein
MAPRGGRVPADSLPAFSVVVVSDFESGEKTWKDEISMARMLARQDVGRPFPLIIVESEAHRGKAVPTDLVSAFPQVQVVYHASEASAELKDYGVSLCTTEWVAVLEADAAPDAGWLRALLEAATTHAQFQVFSGRTDYGAKTSWQRVLNMLDRSFDDCGSSGDTRHISNNGALYRTELLRRFPYPGAQSPFLSSRLRNRRIFGAGYRAWFERKALTRHAIGGLGFVFEFRRHTGFSDMLEAGDARLRRIPSCLLARARFELGHIRRMHREYLRWYDWPMMAALFFFARIPEAVGMVAAVRKGGFERTDYR